jgi:HK97 gp10 family phage protein
MITGKFDIKGFEEINQNLSQLTSRDAKAQYKAAVRQGAKLIRDVARAKAPKGRTGNLRKGIVHKSRKGSRNELLFSIGWKKPEASHGMLIEFGHDVYARGPQGQTARGEKKPVEGTKRARAIPHLRPAGRQSFGRVAALMADELSADKMAARLFKTVSRRNK